MYTMYMYMYRLKINKLSQLNVHHIAYLAQILNVLEERIVSALCKEEFAKNDRAIIYIQVRSSNVEKGY